MTKNQIRILMRQANREVTSEARSKASREVFHSIESSEKFASATTIALYCDLPDEIPTLEAINRYRSLGKRIVLPRVTSDTTMEFYDIDDAELSTGSFGISEPQSEIPISPSEIDLMIVPAVSLCHDGRRLGRGRGYYDRYLSREGVRAHTIGVGYSHQLLNSLPCFEHDVVLHEVITPLFEGDRISILDLMQATLEAAGVDANRLGCGIARLNAMGLSWVLIRYSIETYRTPRHGESIEIETWIASCSRIISTRNFRIVGECGEVIGEASSQWCMIDMKARRATEITSAGINYAEFVQSREAKIEIPRRMPSITANDLDISTYIHTTTEDDIDFNKHVNSVRYVHMMFEMLPPEQLYQLDNRHIDLQYVSEARLGKTLTIKQKDVSTFEISHPTGNICVKGYIGE